MAQKVDRGGEVLEQIAGENKITRFDPKKQFSKRLARLGAVVWAIYAFAVLALIAYRPEAAMACVWLTLIVTCNKAIDTLSYTRNSVTEKILLAGIERTKFEFSLKGLGKSNAGTHNKDEKDDDSSCDDQADEEVSNG